MSEQKEQATQIEVATLMPTEQQNEIKETGFIPDNIRELILNFFCGVYIQMKKPFKVEDRIEIDGIKGDVMNISSLNFEVFFKK